MATNNVLRALAAIFDFFLCLPIHLILCQNEVYLNWVEGLFEVLHKNVNLPFSLLSLFPSIFFTFLVLIIFRIIFQLLFNRSPGQLILGLSLEVSGIKGRLLGVLYVLSSLLLWPVNLILESLDLFSISKFVSGIERKEVEEIPTFRIIIMFVLLFIIVGFASSVPLFFDKSNGIIVADDFSRQKVSKEIEKILNNEDAILEKNIQLFHSRRLKMLVANEQSEQDLIFLPEFDFFKIKKSVKFEPVIKIVDKKRGSEGRIFVHGTIDIAELMKTAFLGDPLSPYFYQKLFDELINKNKPHLKSWDKKDSTLGTMHPLVVEDQVEFLKYILEFDPIEKPLQSISNGPFLNGKLIFRKNLQRIMEMDKAQSISIKTYGNYKFLVSTINTFKEIKQYLLPLGTKFPKLIEISWDGEFAKESSLVFKESYLEKAFWFFDYVSLNMFPELEADMTVLNVFDELTTREIDVNKVDLIEEFLYRYFYSTCRDEFSYQNPFLRGVIKRSLERTNEILKTRSKYKKTFSSFFLEQMESLVRAYAVKDRTYFNL